MCSTQSAACEPPARCRTYVAAVCVRVDEQAQKHDDDASNPAADPALHRLLVYVSAASDAQLDGETHVVAACSSCLVHMPIHSRYTHTHLKRSYTISNNSMQHSAFARSLSDGRIDVSSTRTTVASKTGKTAQNRQSRSKPSVRRKCAVVFNNLFAVRLYQQSTVFWVHEALNSCASVLVLAAAMCCCCFV